MSANKIKYRPFWNAGYEARKNHVPKKDAPKDITHVARNWWALGWEAAQEEWLHRGGKS